MTEQNKGIVKIPWTAGVVSNPVAVVVGKTMILNSEGLAMYLRHLNDTESDEAVEKLTNAYYQTKREEEILSGIVNGTVQAYGEPVIVKNTVTPTAEEPRIPRVPKSKKGNKNQKYLPAPHLPGLIAKIVTGRALRPKEIIKELIEKHEEDFKPSSFSWFLTQAQRHHGVVKVGTGLYIKSVAQQEE